MKNQKIPLCLALLFAVLFGACSENSSSAGNGTFDAANVCPAEGLNSYGEPNRGTFTDVRDGQTYKYTTIGSQVWMAENLNYDSTRPCADDACTKGRMYAHQVALTICPEGWHLPDTEEWHELFASVGGADSVGFRLKATSGWTPLNLGQSSNGADDCNFSLLPVLTAMTSGSENKVDGYVAWVWSSTLSTSYLYAAKFETQELGVKVMPTYSEVKICPVRCVKN